MPVVITLHRAFLAAFLVALGTGLVQAQDTASTAAAEVAIPQHDVVPAVVERTLSSPRGGDDLLFDNGPLVTCDNCGAGGAAISEAQDVSLNMQVWGHNVNNAAGFRMADDFTVDGDGWILHTAEVWAYQTNSDTESTITAVSVRIWNGPPDAPGSEVVYGDDVTDFMIETSWSGIYRVLESQPSNTQRPLMVQVVDLDGLALVPGQYWFDFGIEGTIDSGPWGPPVTIVGECVTGDGYQYVPADDVWNPLVAGATECPQGVPFRLYGEEADVISIEPPSEVGAIALAPAFPNPASGETSIAFSLSEPAHVTLEVFDMLGRRVTVLVAGDMAAGRHVAAFDASTLVAGVYVVRLTAAGHSSTRRVTVMR